MGYDGFWMGCDGFWLIYVDFGLILDGCLMEFGWMFDGFWKVFDGYGFWKAFDRYWMVFQGL